MFNTFGSTFRNISEPVVADDTSPLIPVTRIADAKMLIINLITVEDAIRVYIMMNKQTNKALYLQTGTTKKNVETDFDAAW